MTKERELLKKMYDQFATVFPSDEEQALLDEVEEILAQPEPEPLSDGELEVWYLDHNLATDKEDYSFGFRDAEKAHGIGVEL